MFTLLLLFAPCVISVNWAIVLLLKREKSKSQRYLVLLGFLFGAFYYIDACYSNPNPDYSSLVGVNILAHFVTLSLFPSIILYMLSLMRWRTTSILVGTMYIPPFFLGGATSIIYMMMGKDKAAAYLEAFAESGGHPVGFDDKIYHMFDLFSIKAYRLMIIAWTIASLFLLAYALHKNGYNAGHLRDFFFKGKVSSVANTMCGTLLLTLAMGSIGMLIGRDYMMEHATVTQIFFLIQSCIVYFMFYIGWGFDGTTVLASELRNHKMTWIRYYLEQHPEINASNVLEKSMEESLPKKDQKRKLVDSFNLYMATEKAYLNPDLTIEDVAEALSSNRTYVSSMMKESLGTTFRTYINEQRILTAKEILMNNPGALLSDVAEQSGFKNETLLSKKFTEIVGQSPRSWLKSLKH